MASRKKDSEINLVKLGQSLGITFLAAFIGSYFTTPAIEGWYSDLAKPLLNPPNWVFAPVWTILYILMGLSFYLIWNSNNKKKATAAKVFFIQLVLNSLWSIVFFGLENPPLAFLVIIALWLAIAWTIVKFNEISRKASYYLIPYLLWVSFAAYLNIAIWILN